jgi:hypothetical protein
MASFKRLPISDDVLVLFSVVNFDLYLFDSCR